MENTNPLQKYFRQPAIYIQLPSEGRYYPEGSLDMPPNRELPVYPMTAMDEISYRTADALFNGSAIVSVISSCVPNIKDPWQIPSVDMDALLIGIRIASYGHELDIDTVCPKCEQENTFVLDLRNIMEQVTMPDFDSTVSIGDIEIYFQPLNYKLQNENAIKQFEDQKVLQSVPEADLPEDRKLELINAALVKLGEMTISGIGQSISMIKAGNDIVTEPAHIHDFVKNCDRKFFNQLREKIISIREQSSLQPVNVQCGSCSEQYETPFTLDASNFFGSDS